jgi:hypothetical protein
MGWARWAKKKLGWLRIKSRKKKRKWVCYDGYWAKFELGRRGKNRNCFVISLQQL